MSLCDDLLVQANLLARIDPSRPKQANLRRALSTGYYALFHLLAADASTRMTPRLPALLAARVARTLNHAEMLQVCRAVSSGSPSDVMRGLHDEAASPQMRFLAKVFVTMQEARHAADYDTAAVLTREATLGLLENTSIAFSNWKQIRNSDEATVFLAALLFAKRWDR